MVSTLFSLYYFIPMAVRIICMFLFEAMQDRGYWPRRGLVGEGIYIRKPKITTEHNRRNEVSTNQQKYQSDHVGCKCVHYVDVKRFCKE